MHGPAIQQSLEISLEIKFKKKEISLESGAAVQHTAKLAFRSTRAGGWTNIMERTGERAPVPFQAGGQVMSRPHPSDPFSMAV